MNTTTTTHNTIECLKAPINGYSELSGVLASLSLFEGQGSHEELEKGFDEWYDLGLNNDHSLNIIGEVQGFFDVESTGGGSYESIEVAKTQLYLRGFKLFKEATPIFLNPRDYQKVESAIWKIYKEFEEYPY